MVKSSEIELKTLIKGGETNTVELNENHVSTDTLDNVDTMLIYIIY